MYTVLNTLSEHMYFYRPSQIVCTVTTMHVTCMQTTLCMHKKLCTLLISLSKDYLNPPMSFSFLPCAWLPPPVLSCFSHTALPCADFFVCFHISRICTPAINQTSPSESKGWFPFILICRQELNMSAGIMDNLYQHELRTIYVFIEKYLNVINIVHTVIWLDKNIFHWGVETGLNGGFIMYYFLREQWILKIVSSCPLVLSTCYNWEILVAHPHRPLCFKKIRTTTTTTFFISNTIALNPYSHITTLNPQSFTPLS